MKSLMLFVGAHMLWLYPIFAQNNFKVCFECDEPKYNRSHETTLRSALELALEECGKDLIYNPQKGNPTKGIPEMNLEDRELIKMLHNSLNGVNEPLKDKKIEKYYPDVNFFAIIKLSFPALNGPIRIHCNIISQKRELKPLTPFELTYSDIETPEIVKEKFSASLKTANLCVQEPAPISLELRDQLLKLIKHEFLFPGDAEVKQTIEEIQNQGYYNLYLELKMNFLIDRLEKQLRSSPVNCKESLRIFTILVSVIDKIYNNSTDPSQRLKAKKLRDFYAGQKLDLEQKCN